MERLLGLESSAPRTRTRAAALALGFAVLFALAFLAGRATRVPPAQLALAWPAAGVVILWLLVARSALERLVACVVVIVVSGVLNQLTGTEPLGAWLFGLVNLSHGAVGAALLHRWRPAWLRSTWTTLGDVGVLLGVAAAAAATSGLLGSLVAGWRFDEPFLEGLLIIGFRNVVSSFVVLNALLALPKLWRTRRERGAECPLTMAAALAVTGVLLWLPWPVDFAIVPIVVVVALRCGAQATSVLVALQGVLVVAATVAGNGQFASLDDPQARVVAAQAFVLVLAVVGVVLATLEDARDAALVQSRRDRDQLQDHMEAALLASAHVVVDPDGFVHVDAVNAALVTLTRRPRHALLGVDPRDWFVDDDVEAFRQGICELTLGRALGWRTQLRLDDAWGGGWVDVALALVDPDLDPSLSLGGSGASSAAITLQMIDVTAQKEAEQALAHAALHDDLTGLANRALWADSLERAAQGVGSERSALAVMFIDVDRFKQVNDGRGHAVGDAVLVELAERHSALVGDGATVARLGGDEFVVLCTSAGTREELAAEAQRIMDRLSEPVVLQDGAAVSVTVSIGIAAADEQAEAPLLLRHADQALYAAKDRGRGRAEFYDPTVHAGIESSARLLVDLERAQASGEFSLVFQPIVDVATGYLHAVEALLRWDHPIRGQLRPGDFMPVLEVSDLMHQVGAGVLRAACAHAASLAAQGTPVPVHVNVSAVELGRAGLVARVLSVLDEVGLPPSMLVLEITETQLLDVTGGLVVDLFALRDHGVRIAVDDFGTGYSTLAHLVDLPVDVVKLDGSFVARMTHSRRARSVCAGVVAMAQGIGIDVVAEGVETAEQQTALESLGYRLLQGYHLGRPAPAAPPTAGVGAQGRG